MTTVPNRMTQETVLLDIFDYFSSVENSDYRIIQKSFCVRVWFITYMMGAEFYIWEQLQEKQLQEFHMVLGEPRRESNHSVEEKFKNPFKKRRGWDIICAPIWWNVRVTILPQQMVDFQHDREDDKGVFDITIMYLMIILHKGKWPWTNTIYLQ